MYIHQEHPGLGSVIIAIVSSPFPRLLGFVTAREDNNNDSEQRMQVLTFRGKIGSTSLGFKIGGTFLFFIFFFFFFGGMIGSILFTFRGKVGVLFFGGRGRAR